MSEDPRSEDDGTYSPHFEGSAPAHGFDLDTRLAMRECRSHRLSPANRVAERATFAPPSGTSIPVLDGEERLIFAAENYLGLTQDDRVQDAEVAAAEVVGTGAGASPIATGDTLIHRDLETQLTNVTGADRALVFTSRYAANLGTIAALEPDVVFTDEYTHPSIVDGCRLAGAETVVYGHCDLHDLASKMESMTASARPDESWLVTTESVFGVDGAVAPLRNLCSLVDRHRAWLLVDETHATGLYEGGGGIVRRDGLVDDVHVQTGSLATAFASQGGYVAGNTELIEYLIDAARPFHCSAGLTPPSAAAAAEAIHLARMGDFRSRLWRNAEYLRDGLVKMGYDVPGETQLLPIRMGEGTDVQSLADSLYSRGIVARLIGPPAVPDAESRLRVTPMATHSASDLAACLDAFRDAGREVGLL